MRLKTQLDIMASGFKALRRQVPSWWKVLNAMSLDLLVRYIFIGKSANLKPIEKWGIVELYQLFLSNKCIMHWKVKRKNVVYLTFEAKNQYFDRLLKCKMMQESIVFKLEKKK